MKKIFTLFVSCCAFFHSEAKVITVSNNPNSPGKYTNLQTAINAAAAGDSIYVHGSSTSYGNITVNRRLTFIGTGHKPNKVNTLVSVIGNIQFDTLANISSGSGSKIIGFMLDGIFGYSGGTKNIMIRRNFLTSSGAQIYITGDGWTMENNIINSPFVNINNHANITIQNNIFNNTIVEISNKPSVIILNNIFFGASPAAAFSALTNAIIANNIFNGTSPKGASVDNNIFNNNITYQTAYDTIPFGTNTGIGNFSAQNPLYTNVSGNNFDYTFDFSLTGTSPGKNTGTDGKDIGIYGGVMPFPDMTGSPAVPQIKSLNIRNSVIPMGDSLRVVIKAQKQN